ncbi:hypothetical protein BDZ89DRAFT_205242 [Hymenopellis radicata]|nr:hypothetical protein BDZ89DRAFT_205242 [Hymenopellis radicata]
MSPCRCRHGLVPCSSVQLLQLFHGLDFDGLCLVSSYTCLCSSKAGLDRPARRYVTVVNNMFHNIEALISVTYSLPPTPFPLNLLLQQRRLHSTPAIRDGFRVAAQSCFKLEARGYWTVNTIFRRKSNGFSRRLLVYFFPGFGRLVKKLHRPDK